MTVVSYPLGTPPPAALHGGDCRARDLSQGRNVHGPHRFAATTDCRISNGMLRLTVGATGGAPTLTVEGWRGRVTVGDVYVDTYSDTYGGSIGTPAWLAMGTIAIDSPSVAALLTGVRLTKCTPEVVILHLVAPAMDDAFVVLRRGETHVRIQHGSIRGALVDTDRRLRWTASPSPVGTASTGRVEELAPVIDGAPRYIGSVDPVTANAGAFSLTAASVTMARFGAGFGAYSSRNRPAHLHGQLGDASRPKLVLQ